MKKIVDQIRFSQSPIRTILLSISILFARNLLTLEMDTSHKFEVKKTRRNRRKDQTGIKIAFFTENGFVALKGRDCTTCL